VLPLLKANRKAANLPIHFFDMTTPFECNVRRADYSLMVACVGDHSAVDRTKLPVVAMMRARRDGR
jgi:hypothetical protein